MREYNTGDRVIITATPSELQLAGIDPDLAEKFTGRQATVGFVMPNCDYCYLRFDGERFDNKQHDFVFKFRDLRRLGEAPQYGLKVGDTVRVEGRSGDWRIRTIGKRFATLETTGGKERRSFSSLRYLKKVETCPEPPAPALRHVEVTPRMTAAQDLMHHVISIGERCQRLQVPLRCLTGLSIARDVLKQVMADEIETQTKK